MLADLSGATKQDILELAEAHHVRFLRLMFTDILGVNKNVEIPSSQFRKALDGDIMFDGSSIEGFVRIEESDMLLAPDLSTFKIFPGGTPESRVARLICDITTPDGAPFDGDPRGALKRQVARAASHGFTMNAGMEAEFFMFKLGPDGAPTTATPRMARSMVGWASARVIGRSGAGAVVVVMFASGSLRAAVRRSPRAAAYPSRPTPLTHELRR